MSWQMKSLVVKIRTKLQWNWAYERILVCLPIFILLDPVLIEDDRFSQLMKDINLFVNNEMDANDFEDRVRELFWTSGFIIFTVDKLVQAIIKQVCLLQYDKSCN